MAIGSDPLNTDTDNDTYIDGNDTDPLRDICLYVNLTKMEAHNIKDEWGTSDVYFMIDVYDGDENLLNQSRYNCPDDTNSYEMDYTFAYNIADNETHIYIKIEAWDRGFLKDGQLDLSGGKSDDGSDLLYAYFSYDLKTDTWEEMYGGDPGLDGRVSGMDDEVVVGGQVTLWYWLYTS